jgi:hypothetical protein
MHGHNSTNAKIIWTIASSMNGEVNQAGRVQEPWKRGQLNINYIEHLWAHVTFARERVPVSFRDVANYSSFKT